MSVVIGRPPRKSRIVAAVVEIDPNVDPVSAAPRLEDAAEALRAAGLVLVLLSPGVEVKTRRRRRRKGKET